jgi:hypothetical protein
VTSAVVFNQFKEQLSPNSELFTNVIFAFAFGFGAQRILSEATTKVGEGETGEEEKKKMIASSKQPDSTVTQFYL